MCKQHWWQPAMCEYTDDNLPCGVHRWQSAICEHTNDNMPCVNTMMTPYRVWTHWCNLPHVNTLMTTVIYEHTDDYLSCVNTLMTFCHMWTHWCKPVMCEHTNDNCHVWKHWSYLPMCEHTDDNLHVWSHWWQLSCLNTLMTPCHVCHTTCHVCHTDDNLPCVNILMTVLPCVKTLITNCYLWDTDDSPLEDQQALLITDLSLLPPICPLNISSLRLVIL